jgi:serine/threonine protein kinase
MSQLQHSNLVEFIGVVFSPLQMLMELCPKGDLMHCLQANLIRDVSLKNRIALDIALGMEYLHGQNPPLAHRDLRSPNIFMMSLNPNDKVCAKVADFGLTTSMSTFTSNHNLVNFICFFF